MRRIANLAFIAACVSGPAGLAQADIVKCTDKDGHVTLTDMPCPNATVVVRTDDTGSPQLDDATNWMPSVYEEPTPTTRVVNGVTRITLPPEQFGPRSRREAYARMSRPAPSRMFSTDTATLRAAHDTLVILDGEPRRLAGK